MLSWHRKRCVKADVYLAGQLPFCSSCDHSPSDVNIDLFQSAGPPESPISDHEGLNLSWPSSVSYADECILDQYEADLAPELLGLSRTSYAEDFQAHQNEESSSFEPKATGGYKSLQSKHAIRLLRLSKGAHDDPLHGFLLPGTLDHPPDFEAISYVWADEAGDSTRNSPLFLGPRWDILPITRNCEAALRRLRLADDERVLWIDAVCINQVDISERTHQVGLMSQIYSTASHCLVYLGEHSEDSRMAMELLGHHRLPRQPTDEMCKALANFFRRPYFTRTWILQELVLSNSIVVYCGDNIISWRDVISKPWSQYPTIEIPSWVSNFEITLYRQPLDFPRWIFEVGPLAASDARDKIFAMLGLFKGIDALGFVPDYSLSMAQVYTGVAAYLLKERHMRHILALDPNPTKGLPSWVPDWRYVKPSQWDANNWTSDGPLAKMAQKWPQTGEVIQLGAVLDLLFLQTSHGKLSKNYHNSIVNIHRQTGALLITPKYLIAMRNFLSCSQDPSKLFTGPWRWEFISSNPCCTLDDYVGYFSDLGFWLLLRRIRSTRIYRIIGHCDLCIPLSSQMDHLRNAGTYRVSQGGFDPVSYWVSKEWSSTLWDAYMDFTMEDSISFKIDMSPGKGFLLSEAHSEYMTLPSGQFAQLASRSSTMAKEYPRASRLVQCIRFWSDDNTWEPLKDTRDLFPYQSPAYKKWALLEIRRQKWLSIIYKISRNTVWTTSIDLDNVPTIIKNMETAVPLANAFYRSIENVLDGYSLTSLLDPIDRLRTIIEGMIAQRDRTTSDIIKEIMLSMTLEYSSTESPDLRFILDPLGHVGEDIIREALRVIVNEYYEDRNPIIGATGNLTTRYMFSRVKSGMSISSECVYRVVQEIMERRLTSKQSVLLTWTIHKMIMEFMNSSADGVSVGTLDPGGSSIIKERVQTNTNRIPLPDFSHISMILASLTDSFEQLYAKTRQGFNQWAKKTTADSVLPAMWRFILLIYNTAFNTRFHINAIREECAFIQAIIAIRTHMVEGGDIVII